MGERILIVDDEEILRDNIARFLRIQGHEVDVARSGEEALALVDEASYAVVVTDQRMPGIGGLDLIRRLRDQAPSAVPLLMTAYASVDSAVEALRLGAADYVIKPVALEALAHKVATLLQTRELSERVRRMRQELHERFDTSDLVCRSAAMAAVAHYRRLLNVMFWC